MAKLNEAELLLVSQWDQARLLEKSMERVRDKYAALFTQVVEALASAYPELDARKQYVTQFWSAGAIGIGRSSWPEGSSYQPPGVWLEYLRLEKLAAEDAPDPTVSIWFPPKAVKKSGVSPVAIREAIHSAAKQILGQDEYSRVVKPDASSKPVVHFNAPTKKEILDLFVAGDEAAFVEAIVGYFEAPAKLVPTLDAILKK